MDDAVHELDLDSPERALSFDRGLSKMRRKMDDPVMSPVVKQGIWRTVRSLERSLRAYQRKRRGPAPKVRRTPRLAPRPARRPGAARARRTRRVTRSAASRGSPSGSSSDGPEPRPVVLAGGAP